MEGKFNKNKVNLLASCVLHGRVHASICIKIFQIYVAKFA